jgi:DNA-directed RNA polymerase specialized sigma24 family protein
MSDPKEGFVEKLFAEHHGALQRYFYRRIKSKSDAPDLAQEVYVRMLRIGDSNAIRNPQLYLYTTCLRGNHHGYAASAAFRLSAAR